MSTLPEFIEVSDRNVDAIWTEYQQSRISDLISAYNLCNALLAIKGTNIVERLRGGGGTADQLLDGVDGHVGSHLLEFLAIHGVVARDDHDRYRPTDRGHALLSPVAQAQLGFYREAYGPVFDSMKDLLTGERLYGSDVQRNGEALGRNSAILFHIFHTPIVLRAIRDMGAKYVLDLGCGAGRSLIDACLRDPDFRGIGLDIAPDAIAFARELAAKEGVGDRLDFFVADAFRPETWPQESEAADALMAVGVMHEHFRSGDAAVIGLLDVFADLLRTRMKGFLLGEPELYYDAADCDPDFYLAHILTNQGFPMRSESWLELIPKTRLRCRRVFRRTSGPRLVFYDLIAAN